MSYHQALLCKYLHLQYNLFVIYDESKAFPRGPFDDKVPQSTQQTDRGTSHARSEKQGNLGHILLVTFKSIKKHTHKSQIFYSYPQTSHDAKNNYIYNHVKSYTYKSENILITSFILKSNRVKKEYP